MVFSHHVECLKGPEGSHHGAVLIIPVWRADQQGALHAGFQRPEKRQRGVRLQGNIEVNQKCGRLQGK